MARLLLGRAVAREQGADQLDQAALVGDRGIAARQFLHHDRIGQRVEPGPAEFFGHGDAEQAEPGHLPVDLGRKSLCAVELGWRGRIDIIGEAAAWSRVSGA
jgi:hypothetical protein